MDGAIAKIQWERVRSCFEGGAIVKQKAARFNDLKENISPNPALSIFQTQF